MAAHAGTREQSRPTFIAVRQRVLLCSLVAILAVMDWSWAQGISLNRAPEPVATSVTISGTRVDLACQGRGTSTILVIGQPFVDRVIDDAARAELARYVQICVVNIGGERDSRSNSAPSIADVLLGLLIGGVVPGPYVIITHASAQAASAWVTGPLAARTAGFVLIDPSLPPSSHLVIAANGNQWPLPTNNPDAMALAILKLFWPPDEA